MMKKILISIVLLIVVLVGGYIITILVSTDYRYVTDEGFPVTEIKSSHGFTFAPPDGWVLWEGLSAIQDASYSGADVFESIDGDIEVDILKLQEFITKWKAENATILIYTDSYIDVKTRDAGKALAALGRMTSYDIKNEAEPHNVVSFTVKTDKVIANLPQGSDEENRFDVSNIVINGRDSEYRIIYVLSDLYDTIFIRIPFNDKDTPGYLEVLRRVPKDETDAKEWLKNFLNGLAL